MNSKLLTICLLAAPLSVCAQQPSGQGEDVTPCKYRMSPSTTIPYIYGRSTAGSLSR